MYHVLACGNSFRGLEFSERDRTRAKLRKQVAKCGLLYIEHYWTWDSTERAHLLVTSQKDLEDARKFSNFLEEHGIAARIVTKLPEPQTETREQD